MGADDPERRCLVSRESGPAGALLRLVLSPEGEVFPDYRAKLGGRGAWVTPTRAAIEELEKKPGLCSRAWSTQARTAGLLLKVQEANQRAVEEALAIASRSGVLTGGKDAVRDALVSGLAECLVLANDTSPRLCDDLRSRAGELPVFTVHLSVDELGQRIGKGARSALVVRRSAASRALLRELRWQAALR